MQHSTHLPHRADTTESFPPRRCSLQACSSQIHYSNLYQHTTLVIYTGIMPDINSLPPSSRASSTIYTPTSSTASSQPPLPPHASSPSSHRPAVVRRTSSNASGRSAQHTSNSSPRLNAARRMGSISLPPAVDSSNTSSRRGSRYVSPQTHQNTLTPLSLSPHPI